MPIQRARPPDEGIGPRTTYPMDRMRPWQQFVPPFVPGQVPNYGDLEKQYREGRGHLLAEGGEVEAPTPEARDRFAAALSGSPASSPLKFASTGYGKSPAKGKLSGVGREDIRKMLRILL